MRKRRSSIPSYADAPFHCPPDDDERSRRFLRELHRQPPQPVQSFYDSREWLRIRYRVLAKHGGHCMLCGGGGTSRNPTQVDHIKPRSKYPDLELVESNLQVLCKDCNRGKSNTDETDFRYRPSSELAASVKKWAK